MHGRPRKPLKPEQDEASQAKAAKVRALQSQVLENHHTKTYAKEALEISSKLLELNPEVYTAWNYRKLAVQHNLFEQTNPDLIKSIVNEELRVVENALRRNFKSYGAWHHRKWILSKGFSSLDHEFRLLDQFQKADSRNFHAWNYRRFVAALKDVPAKEELKHTTDMINVNFSNYSAWHNRSVILSQLLKEKAEGFVLKEKILKEEYEFVHQAIFTDPDDQSGWFYHLWLLDQTITPDAPVLISSWPIHDTNVTLSFQGNWDSSNLSPFSSFHSDLGSFPLILYFNEAVEGVSSSTVTVKYKFCKDEGLVWRPLSTSNSSKAHAWVGYLEFPDVKDRSSESYLVEVSLGDSPGIISSSGSHCSFPSRFGFTVSLRENNLEHAEGGTATKVIKWEDESFHTNDTFLQNFCPILSLDQLRIGKDDEPRASKWVVETLIYEIALFRELLLEINCKIGKLTLARLLVAHDAMMTYNTPCVYKKVNTEEVVELFGDLMKLDPTHSRYYKDEQSSALVEQTVSNKKTLGKNCCYYAESSSSELCNHVCLRLNKMSLSKIGAFEHFLWVQMLDISHNELRSIEGLEALQLLSCLNISYNKIISFSALEPLRLLPYLKVLDISYNEIGAHPIDTTRYLCSTPLSHSIDSDCNFDDYTIDDVKLVDYWEVVLTFRGLKLTQLDVSGNAVSNDRLSLLLVKVLPKLKWLNGEAVHLSNIL